MLPHHSPTRGQTPTPPTPSDFWVTVTPYQIDTSHAHNLVAVPASPPHLCTWASAHRPIHRLFPRVTARTARRFVPPAWHPVASAKNYHQSVLSNDQPRSCGYSAFRGFLHSHLGPFCMAFFVRRQPGPAADGQ